MSTDLRELGAIPEGPGALTVRVEVWPNPDLSEDDNPLDYWYLGFAFSGGFRYHFIVHEPYCATLNDWRDLADGRSGVTCYPGNGDGGIKIEGPYATFVGASSGSGGEVTGSFRVHSSFMGPSLHAALDEAVRRGFRFAKK